MESPDGSIGENNADSLHRRPILELEPTPGQKIAFFALDTFHPQAPKTTEIFPLSPLVERYKKQSDNKLALNLTYQQTTSDHGWQDKIFTFAYNYFSTHGAEHAKNHGITDMTQLTPKQAIDLTLKMVVDLTRYNDEDTKNSNHLSSDQFKLTRADESTALELLEEGLRNKANKEWVGNGVCRNFAAITQAVFESLKSNQQPQSMLRNTYIFYNGGHEFAPKRAAKFDSMVREPGHAWNSLVNIEPSGVAKSTIVDATWANIDYDTGEPINADHTHLRMETLVFDAAKAFDDTTPRKDEQMQEILRYYTQNLRFPDAAGGHASPLEIRLFFAKQVVDLARTHHIRQFPPDLNPLLGKIYEQLGSEMDHTELEELWRINHRSEEQYDFVPVVKNFTKDISLYNSNARHLIVGDPKLQRMIVEAIRTRSEFERFLKDAPEFRVRVRELRGAGILPPKFNPREDVADYNELRYLQENSHILRNLALYIPRIVSVDDLNPDYVIRIYQAARTQLKKANASFYKSVEWMNDYEIVKGFDQLYNAARLEK